MITMMSTVHMQGSAAVCIYTKKENSYWASRLCTRNAHAMYLCINKKRIWYRKTCDEHDVFKKATLKSQWPMYKVYLEWSDGKSVEIADESELRLASKLVSASLYDESTDWHDDFQRRERHAMLHMTEPDSESDHEIHSEDDITLDDLYSMGYRHEMDT